MVATKTKQDLENELLVIHSRIPRGADILISRADARLFYEDCIWFAENVRGGDIPTEEDLDVKLDTGLMGYRGHAFVVSDVPAPRMRTLLRCSR